MPKGIYRREKSLIQRFMEKVGPPTATGCREWKAALCGGYGILRYRNANVGAHVAAAMAYYGVIPEGMIVCHRCDNKICVNPSHLYIGTYQENVHGALRRERFMGARKVRLSTKEIAEIRLSPLSNRKLGDQFGISYATIGSIRLGRWPAIKVLDERNQDRRSYI